MICREYGADAATFACALAIREVAIISCALVIFCIDCDRADTRRRQHSDLAAIYSACPTSARVLLLCGGRLDLNLDLLLADLAGVHRLHLGLAGPGCALRRGERVGELRQRGQQRLLGVVGELLRSP